jgi:hypothetical protein
MAKCPKEGCGFECNSEDISTKAYRHVATAHKGESFDRKTWTEIVADGVIEKKKRFKKTKDYIPIDERTDSNNQED